MVADSDGFNPQTVVRSREPLLSPAWSPDGRRLAYVSFERGNSTIYVQEIAHRRARGRGQLQGHQRRPGLLAGRPPPGADPVEVRQPRNLRDGPRQQGADPGHPPLRHRHRAGLDCRTAERLLFTSDRAGKPQVYQVSAAGGEPTRVSFQGESNARATVSFDGKKIAMAQGSGNVYRIAVLDRSFGGSGRWQTLSPGNLDESPSFAPNGSMLLYATKEGRRGVLYAVSADGRVRLRLVTAGRRRPGAGLVAVQAALNAARGKLPEPPRHNIQKKRNLAMNNTTRLASIAAAVAWPRRPAPRRSRKSRRRAPPGRHRVADHRRHRRHTPGRYSPADLDTDSCLRQRVVYFDFDQDTLRPEFQAAIACHAKYLRDRPEARMNLEGNADERGTREYNLGLGERRGNAVSAAIQGNGGSPARSPWSATAKSARPAPTRARIAGSAIVASKSSTPRADR